MSHFVSYSLDYSPLLHESYQKLSHLPGFVLLESTDRVRGRYDILSAYPHDLIQINQDDSAISHALKKIEGIFSTSSSHLDLPFQGGALGYIAYDLGAKLLGIDNNVQPTLQNMPLLDLGLYDWALIADHQKQTLTLFATNTQYQTRNIVDEILTLWNSAQIPQCNATVQSEFIPLMPHEAYQKSFFSIQQSLKEGRSYQVNLTQPFHAAYEGDSWAFYNKISRTNPVPFAAFYRAQAAEILSFSPERFLLFDKGKLSTSPIKGTIGRSNNAVLDNQLKQKLALCEKNKAENVMIVDLLRNDLGKIAKPGSVQVTHLCEVQSFNAVHHLVSTIEAQILPSISPFASFISCFPSGSITGAPKVEAMHIIREQELYARGVYCGSLGYFSRHGRFDTNVAIRTLTAKNNILHLAAGGGIVIDSECEDEYRECFLKIAAVINGLK